MKFSLSSQHPTFRETWRVSNPMRSSGGVAGRCKWNLNVSHRQHTICSGRLYAYLLPVFALSDPFKARPTSGFKNESAKAN